MNTYSVLLQQAVLHATNPGLEHASGEPRADTQDREQQGLFCLARHQSIRHLASRRVEESPRDNRDNRAVEQGFQT